MWSRFRQGDKTTLKPNCIDGFWRRRGRFKAIMIAARFFLRSMGHVTRHRYLSAHILYTRLNGQSHRHANLMRRMLQEYFRIKVKKPDRLVRLMTFQFLDVLVQNTTYQTHPKIHNFNLYCVLKSIKVVPVSEFDTSKLFYEDLIVLIIESETGSDWVRHFIEVSQKKAKLKNLR